MRGLILLCDLPLVRWSSGFLLAGLLIVLERTPSEHVPGGVLLTIGAATAVAGRRLTARGSLTALGRVRSLSLMRVGSAHQIFVSLGRVK